MMNLTEYQLIERTKALYKYVPTLLVGNALASITITTLLWEIEDRSCLVLWFVCLLSILAFRGLSLLRYKKVVITQYNAPIWLKKSELNSFLVGASWGVAILFFMGVDYDLHMQYITLIYFSLVAASIPSVGLHYRSHFVFVAPLTVLFMIKCFYIAYSSAIDSQLYILIVVTATLYIGVMTSFARKTQFAFNDRSRLVFENKELMTEVLEQKEAAENAVHVKNQFLAAASHDLRQPLHALGLYASAFSALKLSDEAKGIAHEMKQSTNALSDLLNGLLDVSSLDANSVEYRPEHIAFTQVLDLIVSEYALVAKGKGTVIESDIEAGLYIYSDELLVQRAIRNLVDNAVKFTDNGVITISARRDSIANDANVSEWVEVVIEDTGLGIPDSEHKSVFSEFTQLHNPERDRQKGQGLGLSIVQRLCQLMGVQLTMHSASGKGTRFTLQLPSGSLTAMPEIAEREISQDDAMVAFADKTVLILDDEIMILNAMQNLLKQWGLNVITAANIEEALDQLYQLDMLPDLILADFRLRDNVDGTHAVMTIRDEFNTHIPAILITGDTSPDRLQLAKASNLPLLHKPVDAKKLNQALALLLSQQ